MPRIFIGTDDFYKVASTPDTVLVDKTLLIQEIIEDYSEVLLITRPRRWGKTLNMRMLQCFFSKSVDSKPTAGLFDRFKIAQIEGGKYIKEHQGQYPVIFITFKDVQADNFEGCFKSITLLIKQIYDRFWREIGRENIEKLGFLAEQTFNDILKEKNPDQTLIEQSLKLLSEYLYQHYKKEVYILIDEYDKPLNAAYGKDYFNKLSDFMRNIFSSCLKGNSYLKKGIMTGVLRISKGTMLSGLNNLNEFSLLDKHFAEYFGFTLEEVIKLLQQLKLDTKGDEIKDWYNGYKVGGLVLYNPWSIMKCLEQEGRIGAYWVDTTDDILIKRTLVGANPEIKEQLLKLIKGESIKVKINKNITYERLTEGERSLWSLLLFTGYLRAETTKLDTRDNLYECDVMIPNQEIMSLYNQFMVDWFANTLGGEQKYELFVKKLLDGKVELFTEDLGAYLLTCASIYDVSKQPEAFYHGFVLALIASLQNTHIISSNRESGLGRYDIMIIPKRKENGELGIILEFKHAKENQSMEDVAKTALKQIEAYAYQVEFNQYKHVKTALKVGMAFSGKAVLSIFTCTNLQTQEIKIGESQELSLDEDYIEQIQALSPKKESKGAISPIASQEEEDIILPAPRFNTKRRRIVLSDEIPVEEQKTGEPEEKKQKTVHQTSAYASLNIHTKMRKEEQQQEILTAMDTTTKPSEQKQ